MFWSCQFMRDLQDEQVQSVQSVSGAAKKKGLDKRTQPPEKVVY